MTKQSASHWFRGHREEQLCLFLLANANNMVHHHQCVNNTLTSFWSHAKALRSSLAATPPVCPALCIPSLLSRFCVSVENCQCVFHHPLQMCCIITFLHSTSPQGLGDFMQKACSSLSTADELLHSLFMTFVQVPPVLRLAFICFSQQMPSHIFFLRASHCSVGFSCPEMPSTTTAFFASNVLAKL